MMRMKMMIRQLIVLLSLCVCMTITSAFSYNIDNKNKKNGGGFGIQHLTRHPLTSSSMTTTTTTTWTTSMTRNTRLHAKKPNTNINKGSSTRNHGGDGYNWMDRSTTTTTTTSIPHQEQALPQGFAVAAAEAMAEMEQYDIGISGISFQTGPLSLKIYNAIISRQQQKQAGTATGDDADDDDDIMSSDMKKAYKMYAMDFTAREAVQLALRQNGFESFFDNNNNNNNNNGGGGGVGLDEWGMVDSIQCLDAAGRSVGPVYDSWDSVVDAWTPGQTFHFVARCVSAKAKELVLDEVYDALDPDGTLRNAAEDKGINIPTEDIQSLHDLSKEVTRRCEEAPRGSKTADDVYTGQDKKRGYMVMKRNALLRRNAASDGRENQKSLMHVMNALVAHGCLIVDLAKDEKDDYDDHDHDDARLCMAQMWQATKTFFDALDSNPEKEAFLPRMASIKASPYAKLGYANFQDGMKFMETRINRESKTIMPSELSDIMGQDGMKALEDAFGIITEMGKDVIRIATAASSVENEGFHAAAAAMATATTSGVDAPVISGFSFLEESDSFDQDDEDDAAAAIMASRGAAYMVEELVDDGTTLPGNEQQGPVSMSPHRLCQYSNIKENVPTEVFGAHTDSSFVTIVPVAAVSGLEVYDEEAEDWYRPELRARATWESERIQNGLDPNSDTEILNDGTEVPWHCRYIVVMPGEFLQVVTRNEIAAAVHRVVASGPARLSAPILMRGRPGVPMDVEKYIGEINSKLLEQVNGKNMQEIHDALQPSSSR